MTRASLSWAPPLPRVVSAFIVTLPLYLQVGPGEMQRGERGFCRCDVPLIWSRRSPGLLNHCLPNSVHLSVHLNKYAINK